MPRFWGILVPYFQTGKTKRSGRVHEACWMQWHTIKPGTPEHGNPRNDGKPPEHGTPAERRNNTGITEHHRNKGNNTEQRTTTIEYGKPSLTYTVISLI